MSRFQEGQKIIRYLSSARIPMPLTVTKVHEGLVMCGPWTFDDETGVEEDAELGWGAAAGITGSWIEEATEEEWQQVCAQIEERRQRAERGGGV